MHCFGKYAGKGEKGAPHSGIHYFAGRLRARRTSNEALKSRHANLEKRGGKLVVLRKIGSVDMRKLFVTGLQQFGYYGAEVLSLSPSRAEIRTKYVPAICRGASDICFKGN